MTGVFACPECGEELAVEGLTPGREILCEGCSTWVEVPYLPRAGESRRTRRTAPRSPWNSLLLKGAIGFAVVALLILLATKTIVGRLRSDEEKVLAVLIASADQAEADHRYGAALVQINAAVSHAETQMNGLKGSNRLEELKERRDQILRRDVEDRLAGVDALGTDQAVGEAKTLAALAEQNPALDSLAGAIEAKLATLRLRQAEADLARARKASEAGRDVEAFDVADRLFDRTSDLARSDASRFQAEARSILETAVARKGVALPPVVGRFVAGSAETYTKALDRSRAEILRSKGYLPEPRESGWSALWSEKAPFRATILVVETQDELYMQSKNRTTQIEGMLEFCRGDQSLWSSRVLAKTRMPLPNQPALLAGHLATADKRKPETERLLHDDAMKQFLELTSRNLRGIPTQP